MVFFSDVCVFWCVFPLDDSEQLEYVYDGDTIRLMHVM